MQRIVTRILTWFTGLCLLFALMAAGAHALNHKDYDGPGVRATPLESHGFGGSVKGRVFPGVRAAGWFNTDIRDAVFFNLDNFSSETYKLKARGPLGEKRVMVGPGLTRLRMPAPGGPVYLRFEWDRPPRGVVMTRLDTREYVYFRRALTAAMFSAGLLLILLLFFRAAGDAAKPRYAGLCFAAALIFFTGLYFQVFHNALIPLTGDEPHYMIQAESLARDGDANIADNHRHRYHAMYFPGPLEHHGFVPKKGEGPGAPSGPGAPRAFRSFHFPLLSILLMPAFAPGIQVNHYVVSKFIMILLVAFTAAGILLFASARGGIPGAIIAGSFLTAIPFLPYTNQIFPETGAAALVLVFAFHLLGALYPDAVPGFSRRPYVAAPALALLPLLHLKFAAMALAGGIGLLYLTRRENAKALIFVAAILMAGALGSAAFAYLAYGSFLGPYDGGAGSYFADAFRRYTVYFLDADRGLLSLAPLMAAVPAGLLVLFRRAKAVALIFAAIIIAGHVPNLFHHNFLLGSGPVGRYWIAVSPLLMLCAFIGLESILRVSRERGGLVFAAAMLVIIVSALRTFAGTAAFLANQEAFYGPTPKPFVIARFLNGLVGEPDGLAPVAEFLGTHFAWSFPNPISPGVVILAIAPVIFYIALAARPLWSGRKGP